MSDSSGPVQTDSPADVDRPQFTPAVYPPDYPFAPQYAPGHDPQACRTQDIAIAAHLADAPHRQQTLYVWTAIALVGSCFVNLVLAAMVGPSEPIPLMAALFAALLSQLALQSLWIVFSPRPLWQRQLAGILLGWLLLGAFLMGIGLGNQPADLPEVARIFLCSVPLVMLSVQTPLWGLRIYARWQVVPTTRPAAMDRPLTIGDMIAATLAVAIAFGFIRLASDEPGFYQVAWIGWLIAVPSIAGIALVSLAPLVYLVLRPNAWPVGGFLAWCGEMTILLTAAAILIAMLGGRPDAEGIVLLFLSTFGAGTATWLGLWGLRTCGYRLVTGRDREPTA
jgi:hypothetical protein